MKTLQRYTFFFSTLIYITLLLSACGSQTTEEAGSVTIQSSPFSEIKTIAAKVKAYLEISGKTCEFELDPNDTTLKDNQKCTDIPMGSHPYKIVYKYTETGVILANTEGTINLISGKDNEIYLASPEKDIDDDGDGFKNFYEILQGTNPKDSGSKPVEDKTPPAVSTTSPANNSTNVPVNSKISATFSEAIDSKTMIKETFTVSNGSTTISGTVVINGTTATFTPSGNLSYNTTYNATIGTGVKDLAGNTIAGNYSWSFSTEQIIQQNDLIAYFPFNGNANDESGNGHNGTVNGAGLVKDRFDNDNSAYSFDGNDYISLANTGILNFTSGGFTLLAWVNFTANNNDKMIILKHNGGYGNGYFIGVGNYGGPTNIFNFFVNNDPRLKTTETYNDGKWHFVAGVYDGANQYLYVDGVLKASQQRTYTSTNNREISIGNGFNGLIDEVRIYNRDLSASEIQTLYSFGTNSDTTAPSNTTGTDFINNGAASTNSTSITLSISATDSVGVTGYYASENSTTPSLTASGWALITATASYSDSVPFTLSDGEGIKTIYVWFRDTVGNVSASKSDSINIDTYGLIAYYPFNGNANDETGNSHNGTVSGASLITDRFGNANKAYSFDGTDEVRISHNTDMNVQLFTISAWVFPTLIDGWIETILNKEPETGFDPLLMQYEIGIRGSGLSGEGIIPEGNLALFIGGISGLPDEFKGWVDGGGSVPLNTWTHVVLIFDGSSAKTYINGVLKRTITSLSGSVGFSAGPLKIGSRSAPVIKDDPQARFNGSIDDVRIYNRALSASEIQILYNQESSGMPDTTVPSNTSGSNFINSGVATTNSTNITLTLSATDNAGITGYCAKESSTAPSVNDTCWTSITPTNAYSAGVTFTLSSGDGAKTVYVWFKDAFGNISDSNSDSIILDTVLPISVNLITNGSFEIPNIVFSGMFNLYGVGSTAITGWTVVGGEIALVPDTFLSLPASDGQQSVDLTGINGYGKGLMSDAVTTHIGATYRLSFDIGAYSGYGTASLNVSINGATTNVFTNIYQVGRMDWETMSLLWVANSTSATITFLGDSNNSNDGVIGLDNIVFIEIIPAPMP